MGNLKKIAVLAVIIIAIYSLMYFIGPYPPSDSFVKWLKNYQENGKNTTLDLKDVQKGLK